MTWRHDTMMSVVLVWLLLCQVDIRSEPGGGLKYFWNFHPNRWGNDPIWLYHIFEMGWNHQLERRSRTSILKQLQSYLSVCRFLNTTLQKSFAIFADWKTEEYTLENSYAEPRNGGLGVRWFSFSIKSCSNSTCYFQCFLTIQSIQVADDISKYRVPIT